MLLIPRSDIRRYKRLTNMATGTLVYTRASSRSQCAPRVRETAWCFGRQAIGSASLLRLLAEFHRSRGGRPQSMEEEFRAGATQREERFAGMSAQTLRGLGGRVTNAIGPKCDNARD
jgi:hypothetical protein